MKNPLKTTGAAALIIGFVAVIAVLAVIIIMALSERVSQTACTEEAKFCPNGSFVSRTGPDCEFEACPELSVPENWKTVSGENYFFNYPESLPTEYITALDWPPAVQVLKQAFTCFEAGDEEARAGKTERRVMNGREYCVTEITEGAAGSIYTQYAYASSYGRRTTAVLTFSTRAVQCGNYDDPEKTACEEERSAFNLNVIVDGIFHTLSIVQ